MKKFLWTLLIIVSFVIIAISISPISMQNDTFYSIKVGEQIIKEGFVQPDTFIIHEDIEYSYPHWLFDVIVYIVFKYMGGFPGLYIFEIVLAFLIGMLLFFTNINLLKNKYLAYLISAITLIILKPFITVRAQMITYITFILEIFFLEKYVKGNNKLYLIGLFILSLIIVNNHVAVWPFFFILFLPYFVSYLKIKFNKIESEKNKGKLVWLIITFFLCILAGFITPIGLTPFTYFIKTMQGTTTQSIAEHQPLNLLSGIGLYAFIYIIVVLFLTWMSDIKVKTKNVCLFCGMVLLALSSKRHVSLLYIVMSFLFTPLLISVYESFAKEELDNVSAKFIYYFKKLYFIVIIGITSYVVIRYGRGVFNTNREYVNPSSYPVEAAKFINENIEDKENMRLFNEYNYGSYLMLENIKVFIDSRADLYTKEFNGKKDIFTDYMNTSGIGKYYENTFEEYNISHVILAKNSKLNMFISRDSKYNEIYSDDKFVLYKREIN